MYCLQQQLLNGRIVAFAVERMLGADEIRAASTDKRRACSTRDKYASDGHNPQLATAHGDKSFSISLFSAQVIWWQCRRKRQPVAAHAAHFVILDFSRLGFLPYPYCRVGGASDELLTPLPPPSTFPCIIAVQPFFRYPYMLLEPAATAAIQEKGKKSPTRTHR